MTSKSFTSDWFPILVLIENENEDGDFRASIHEVPNGDYGHKRKEWTGPEHLTYEVHMAGGDLSDYGYKRPDLPEKDGVYKVQARVSTGADYDYYSGGYEGWFDLELAPKEQWEHLPEEKW